MLNKIKKIFYKIHLVSIIIFFFFFFLTKKYFIKFIQYPYLSFNHAPTQGTITFIESCNFKVSSSILKQNDSCTFSPQSKTSTKIHASPNLTQNIIKYLKKIVDPPFCHFSICLLSSLPMLHSSSLMAHCYSYYLPFYFFIFFSHLKDFG